MTDEKSASSMMGDSEEGAGVREGFERDSAEPVQKQEPWSLKDLEGGSKTIAEAVLQLAEANRYVAETIELDRAERAKSNDRMLRSATGMWTSVRNMMRRLPKRDITIVVTLLLSLEVHNPSEGVVAQIVALVIDLFS